MINCCELNLPLKLKYYLKKKKTKEEGKSNINKNKLF